MAGAAPARLPAWPACAGHSGDMGHAGTIQRANPAGTAGATPWCRLQEPKVAHPSQGGAGQSLVPGL